MYNSITRPEILDRVITIMRRDLKLGSDIPIDESMTFFGGDADIDSLDILLLLTSIEREFKIKIPSEEVGRQVFENLGTLCNYLQQQLAGKTQASPGQPAGTSATPVNPIDRLPHQPPFRFISQITSVEPGKSARGAWSVSGREDFFRGHFPGKPIVPGVLIAEALAQLCGVARTGADGEMRLAHVDVRFESSIAPPADIQLSARVALLVGNLLQCDVEASCRGVVVARGSITLGWSDSNASARAAT